MNFSTIIKISTPCSSNSRQNSVAWLLTNRIWRLSTHSKLGDTIYSWENHLLSYSICIECIGKTDTLFLHLMFVLALRLEETRLIKFEAVESKNSQVSINVYKSKMDRTQPIFYFSAIIWRNNVLKQNLLIANKYQETTRFTIKGDAKWGNFWFWNSRNAIGKKLNAELLELFLISN